MLTGNQGQGRPAVPDFQQHSGQGSMRFRPPDSFRTYWDTDGPGPPTPMTSPNLPHGKTPLITGKRGSRLGAWISLGKCSSPQPCLSPSPGRGERAGCWPSPAHTLLQMPLGSEGLLPRRLFMCVLELPVLPLGGPADSHRPNGHPSLGRPSC